MSIVDYFYLQYNEINNTNKQFKYYLENKQTQELLKFYQNNTDGRNSDYQYKNEEKYGCSLKDKNLL